MLVGPLEPGAHGVNREMGSANLVPSGGGFAPGVGIAVAEADPALYPNGHGVPARVLRVLAHLGYLFLAGAVGLKLGEPAIGQASNATHYPLVSAAEPDRDGLLYWTGIDAGMGDLVVPALEVHDVLGPERPQQLYLLDAAPATVVEVLAQGLVLHVVPPDADAQPKAASGQHVDFRSLFGH